LSLFSGIGAFEKALSNIGLDYDLVGYSEIDKYPSAAYSAIHNVNEDKNLGDIKEINAEELEDFNLMTYGFPCQDISVAGGKEGFSEGKGTRSGLLWEAMRIAKEKKPQVMVAENVPNLLSNKFKDDLNNWLNLLDKMGYETNLVTLNAQNFGVPQNRKRVFIVSSLSKLNLQVNSKSNKKVLKDILDKEVREKYYLNEEYHNRYKKSLDNEKLQDKIPQTGDMLIKGTTQPLRAKGTNSRHWIHDINKLVGTLSATDYKQPKQVDINNFDSTKYTLRKLTPLEYFRLMGFDGEDYYKARKRLENKFYHGNDQSDTRMYKMAGNSIVVPVLEELFKEIYKEELDD
jgi:DNA (cytosine-5)-methyltransferase 1